MASSKYTSYARKSDESAPDDWYRKVEKAKDKARKSMNMVMGIEQENGIVIGIVTGVDIDRLWQFKYPYCKVSMTKAVRFGPSGNIESNIGDIGVFWVCNPEKVMPLDELAKRYPRVHSEVQVKMKTSGW